MTAVAQMRGTELSVDSNHISSSDVFDLHAAHQRSYATDLTTSPYVPQSWKPFNDHIVQVNALRLGAALCAPCYKRAVSLTTYVSRRSLTRSQCVSEVLQSQAKRKAKPRDSDAFANCCRLRGRSSEWVATGTPCRVTEASLDGTMLMNCSHSLSERSSSISNATQATWSSRCEGSPVDRTTGQCCIGLWRVSIVIIMLTPPPPPPSRPAAASAQQDLGSWDCRCDGMQVT